jgi:hypothetical protein
MTTPDDEDGPAPQPTPARPAAAPPASGAAAPGPRFAEGGVLVGVLLSFFGTPLLTVLGSVVDVGVAGPAFLLTGLVGPLVAGLALLAVGRTAVQRGLGLGLTIGWGVIVVVGAGLCIALISSLGY